MSIVLYYINVNVYHFLCNDPATMPSFSASETPRYRTASQGPFLSSMEMRTTNGIPCAGKDSRIELPGFAAKEMAKLIWRLPYYKHL